MDLQYSAKSYLCIICNGMITIVNTSTFQAFGGIQGFVCFSNWLECNVYRE